jgi:hypothetical protein
MGDSIMPSIIRATTTSGLQIAPDNSGSLILQTNGTTAAVTLDTSQNATFAGKVTSAGALTLASNGTTTAVTIDTSQNVGIGTTSPAVPLDVVSLSANGYGISLRGRSADNASTLNLYNNAGTTRYGFVYADTGGPIFGSVGALPTMINTNGLERMRIDSSGNVLVGTTTNASSAAKIMVSSTAPQMAVDGNGAGVNSLINWTTSGVTKAQTYFDAANVRFYIACNNGGGVYLSSQATSWTSVSDERVKDIIEPIENATEKLGNWRAVIGKYKTDEEGIRRPFLIAQDVLSTFPEAVDTTNEEEYGLRYQDTIPLLVSAIQEQQTIINDLKARVETLEAN